MRRWLGWLLRLIWWMSCGRGVSSGSAALELVAPAHLWVPERFGSLGAEVIDLASAVGLVLDPEQELLVDAVGSVDASGAMVALEASVVQPRQNGKTVGFEALALADLFLFARPGDLFTWTAHRYKTTVEAFRDLKRLIDGSAMLSRRVKRMPESFGDELVELVDGTRLVFLARQSTGGRGLSGRRVTLDEAFALTPAIMGSLFPIMSAQDDAQIRYASSAGLASSEVLHGVVQRGRTGGDPGLVHVEWRVPRDACASGRDCGHGLDAVGCALDDRGLLQRANPAAGRRISWEYLANERRAFSGTPAMLAELVRERLGWEDDLAGAPDPILAAFRTAWPLCADRESVAVDRVVFAADVHWDRSASSIVCGGVRSDGLAHLELVGYEPGTEWVVPRLVELAARFPGATVALDPVGPVGSLVPELERAEIEPLLLGLKDMKAACGLLFDAVTKGQVRSVPEPVLDSAAGGAAKRQLEDAWAWRRRDSPVDISPLIAATVAHWAVSTAEEFAPSVLMI